MNDLPENPQDAYNALREEVLKVERRQSRLVIGSQEWQTWERVRLEAVVNMNMFACMSGDLTVNPDESVGITSQSGRTITSQSSYTEHLHFAIERPRLLPVNSSKPQGYLSVFAFAFFIFAVFRGSQR